jgi:hypothetical protein
MARDASFIFVPWELTRSLNTLGDMLLASSPRQAKESAALFTEEAVAEKTLAVAPTRSLLDQSLNTWREVASRSAGDAGEVEPRDRVEQLLATLQPALGR